jgi:uncharacterized membrane protein YeaQ/YmgE (transglycosylase-associated protein family)
MEALLVWTVLGLVAGILAKFIMPGRQGWNPITSIILGILGSITGGWIAGKLGWTGASASTGHLSMVGIATAVAGALLILFIWRLITGKK